jgi:hypothetical protein
MAMVTKLNRRMATVKKSNRMTMVTKLNRRMITKSNGRMIMVTK